MPWCQRDKLISHHLSDFGCLLRFRGTARVNHESWIFRQLLVRTHDPCQYIQYFLRKKFRFFRRNTFNNISGKIEENKRKVDRKSRRAHLGVIRDIHMHIGFVPHQRVLPNSSFFSYKMRRFHQTFETGCCIFFHSL